MKAPFAFFQRLFLVCALAALPALARAEVLTYESITDTKYITAQVGILAINLDRMMLTSLAMIKYAKESDLKKSPEAERPAAEEKINKKIADAEQARELLQGFTASKGFRDEAGKAFARVNMRELTHDEIVFLIDLFDKMPIDKTLDQLRGLQTRLSLNVFVARALKEDYLPVAQTETYKSIQRKMNSNSFTQDVKLTLDPIVEKYTTAARVLRRDP